MYRLFLFYGNEARCQLFVDEGTKKKELFNFSLFKAEPIRCDGFDIDMGVCVFDEKQK